MADRIADSWGVTLWRIFALQLSQSSQFWPRGPRSAALPQLHEPAMLAEHRIGLRHFHLRNRLQRPRVIFRRRPRDLHRGSRRVGADDAEIIARRDALMPGAGGQDGDIAGGNL